jgi:hypothetical protein
VKTFWTPVLIFNDLRLTNPSNPRRRVRYDRIDDWEIETRFHGSSTALDGPPLFWKVSFYTSTGPSETRHFGTKEAALAFHAEVVERVKSGEFQ